ncbi:hypothetical protein Y032_0587g347 [Ancylostoma ceylanicum]|uniref:Transposase n=1 Tax=Ancylostoma ceylanicum TaxID=53326 RepID=A0A016WP04_9BILA|nr:hypothetical protein Y032_0587g347 [Ancylostoma ceylanicum]
MLSSPVTKKVMLCTLWNMHGVEYWELLGEGFALIADVYVEQLRNLKTNLENVRPQLHELYLQRDNARPHIARTSKAELMKFG